MGRPGWWILAWFLLTGSLGAAERWGDIVVAPQAVVSGETHHGYVEHRVVVANESASRSHTVTLRYPETATPFGDRLERLSRSIRLGPNASAQLALWQPPIPVMGNGFAVWVDGRYQGSVPFSGYNRHAQLNYGVHGMQVNRTLLISRSLNNDEVNAALTQVFGKPFSASKAIGAPDSAGGLSPTAWVPANTNTAPGADEWLELDYAPAFVASEIHVVEPMNAGSIREVELFNTNGVAIGHYGAATRHGNLSVFNFPMTTEPVARVRLTVFNRRGVISPIDAVELIGPQQRAWAVDARASSHMTTLGPTPGMMPAALIRRYGLTGGPASVPSEGASYTLVRSELDAAQWSDQWLAYSAFDAILITARDYEAFPQPVRTALWRFAEGGGCLVAFGPIEVPEAWRPAAGSKPRDNIRIAVGFGSCLRFPATDPKQLSKVEAGMIMDDSRNAAWPWTMMPNLTDPASANQTFPIIAEIKIPFRSMVLILLVFVVVIGPVNLILLARLKRRIWSLWTIPVISFLTCGIVFGYSFLGEGITSHVRVEGLTLLDQISHRATTLGLAAYYCPLTPSSGLQFSYETELTPILAMATDFRGRGVGRGREMDWTQSQHLQSGWLASRVPTFFRIRKSESRRERIQLEKTADGRVAAVNGLGATVRSLKVTDFNGQVLVGTNLLAGQRAVLQPESRLVTGQTPFALLADIYRLSSWGPVEPLWQRLQTNAQPRGTYVALVSGTPFLESGLGGKNLEIKDSAVYGLLNPKEDRP